MNNLRAQHRVMHLVNAVIDGCDTEEQLNFAARYLEERLKQIKTEYRDLYEREEFFSEAEAVR